MQIKIHLVNKIWQCGKDRYGSHGEDVEGGASADLVGHSGPAETAHKITWNWNISWTPREGVIIEWPLNGQFHDARDVIMMFWTDIFEVEDVDDDDIQALGNVF